jgi:hypothetical protein
MNCMACKEHDGDQLYGLQTTQQEGGTLAMKLA